MLQKITYPYSHYNFTFQQSGKMEKQNLPYRHLRNQKMKSTKFFRKSLLVPLRKKQTEHKSATKMEKSSIMSQNVSQYLHMLSNCHIKENYIKWAINLRTNSPIKNKQAKEAAVPDVYFKETKTSENRKNSVEELKRKKFNTADYSQYLSKNEKFAFFNESCLDYITSLRGYSDHNKNNSTDKERFSSIPARNRTNYPTFLKKQFVKKTKAIKEQDEESGLDGTHKYPKYSEGILRDRNYGLLSSFTNGKNKISLPTLAWQVGLRSYCN